MDQVELTINGKKVKAPRTSSILKAALDNGIYIPKLCWDRRLTPYGGCRLCLVEMEGQRKLFASCSTPVKDGMEINTESDRIARARKSVLELLLVNHPLDCPICDKAGECELQDLAFKYGPSASRFKGERKQAPEVTTAPLLERNPNRCILCGKCVRICGEHQGVGAIDLIGRGYDTEVSPAFEESLDCEFCGQCVDVCPVGALGSKPFRFRSRAWYMEEKNTVCPYCGCGCTVTLGISEGKIIRSVGTDGVGLSKGDLCGRGRFGVDYVHSDKRLTKPLIRKDGKLQEATWEEATAYISENLKAVIDSSGPEAVGAIGSQRCTVEDNYMLQKFMREAVGTNNIDSLAALGYSKAQKGIKQAFGLDTLPIDYNSPLTSDSILVVESDITSTHPVWGLKLYAALRDFGATLTVIDPKLTKLSRHASEWLRNTPGTAVAVLNGMMRTILDEGIHDKDAESHPGFAELKSKLEEYTPEKVEGLTGIHPDRLKDAARKFAAAERPLACMTLGANENNKSTDTVLATANLLMLVGAGADALEIPAELTNTIGMFEAGIRPDAGPSHTPLEKPGLGLVEMFYGENSPVKAMFIMGENPVVSFPQAEVVEGTLKGLDLLVVQDLMLSDTAKLAHVVLPAASWGEKEGTVVGASGQPQKVIKCIEQTGESVPDWQIFRNLARFMQKDTGLGTLESLQQEIEGKVSFEFDSSKATPQFNPVDLTMAEETDKEYPLKMVTGNLMQHSGSLTTLSKGLESVVSDAIVQMNKADAKVLEIGDEGYIKVASRRGEITLKAKVTDEVPEGMLYVPSHFPHARVHLLTYPSANGAVSIVAVKVEKA